MSQDAEFDLLSCAKTTPIAPHELPKKLVAGHETPGVTHKTVALPP
jgi:hypothetical protein